VGTSRRMSERSVVNANTVVKRALLQSKRGYELTNAGAFLPQICHKPKQTNSENGGFLRVTAATYFVAKIAEFRDLIP